jgi:hypothetical protein
MVAHGSNRVDAGGILKLFEWSLPICMTSYDVFFRNGEMTEYYHLLSYSAVDAFLLRRKNYKTALLLKIETREFLATHHPELYRNICESRFADERYIEQANSIISNMLRGRDISGSEEEAIKIVKIGFAKRMKSMSKSSVTNSMPTYQRSLGTGRRMGDMVVFFAQRILDVCELLVNSAAPTRVMKTNSKGVSVATDYFRIPAFLPTLCSRKAMAEVNRCNRKLRKGGCQGPLQAYPPPNNSGHPNFGFAYFSAAHASASKTTERRRRAPDGERSASGCNMPGCGGNDSTFVVSFCCHSICTTCSHRWSNCLTCQELNGDAMTKLLLETQTCLGTKITEEMVRSKAAASKQEANDGDGGDGGGDDDDDQDDDAEDEDEEDAVDNDESRLEGDKSKGKEKDTETKRGKQALSWQDEQNLLKIAEMRKIFKRNTSKDTDDNNNDKRQ